MSEHCALCGNPITAEQRPIVIGADGLPDACALRTGLGVPVVNLGVMVTVSCDGEHLRRCVGYDRVRGLAWRMAEAGGRVMTKDGDAVIEMVEGVITVERMS